MLYKLSKDKFQPFKAVCANCKEWLTEEESHSLYNSDEVVCSQCYGELEAKQLDKPEE